MGMCKFGYVWGLLSTYIVEKQLVMNFGNSPPPPPSACQKNKLGRMTFWPRPDMTSTVKAYYSNFKVQRCNSESVLFTGAISRGWLLKFNLHFS